MGNIDHAAEAVNFLGAATINTYGDDDRKVAIAHVHATLALAEQHRAFGLIALGFGGDERYKAEIAAALGLNKP